MSSESHSSHATGINDLPPELLSDILAYLNPHRHILHDSVDDDGYVSSTSSTNSQTDFARIAEEGPDSDEDVDSSDGRGLEVDDDLVLSEVEPVADDSDGNLDLTPRWYEYFPKPYIVSCASVSRRWRQTALPYLFQDVILTLSESGNDKAYINSRMNLTWFLYGHKTTLLMSCSRIYSAGLSCRTCERCD